MRTYFFAKQKVSSHLSLKPTGARSRSARRKILAFARKAKANTSLSFQQTIFIIVGRPFLRSKCESAAPPKAVWELAYKRLARKKLTTLQYNILLSA
jgi:hypothetical protein